MKYLNLGITLLVGVSLGVATEKLLDSQAATFKVGECVRQLGSKTVEKVITTTDLVAVETEYYYGYNRRAAYYGGQADTLVKVSCKNFKELESE